MKPRLAFWPLALLPLLPMPAGAQTVVTPPAVMKFATGFDYSRGSYGFADDTEVLSIPANFSYEQDQWLVRVIVPWLTLKGPASVVDGGGTPRPTTQSTSGLGDVLLSGTLHALRGVGQLNLDLTARAKLPTADEDRGLGTGRTDSYLQLEFYRAFDRFIPFATVGYRFLGHSPVYPLKDGAYASLGSSLRVSPRAIVGAAYDWHRRILANADDGEYVTAFFAFNPNLRWNVTGYLLKGLNDGSPDVGVGALVAYRF